jgi:hypothetical protein
MIFEAVNFIAEEMNEFFRNKLKVKEDKVMISSIVDQAGAIAIQGENKIIITLTNIEKEISIKSGSVSGGQSLSKPPLVNINLYLLFSAYFNSNNYAEALRFISFVIAYFQSHNVFTRSGSSGLDEKIDKLIMEMADVSTEQLNNMWGTIGAKYMPSVLYKMRMLTFDDSIISEIRPVISGLDNFLN